MTDYRLWLPFVACHYMDTTGDTAVLDTRQPFIEGPELEPGVHEAYYRPTTADTDASLYEHCARAIDASLSLGAHDLPLFRSEEHTSELQSLMRISYAIFCLKQKTTQNNRD